MAKKKKKNLRLDVSTLYLGIAFLFILGFGFFGTSKLFMAEDIPLNQTELNEEFDLKSNGKFTITSWVYDKDQQMMEVSIATNGIESYMTMLDFTAVSREQLAVELPTEIVYNENDIYIVQINEVPNDFNQLALRFNKGEKSYGDLFVEGAAEDEEKNVISTIYTDQRVVEEAAIEDRNFTEYAMGITETLIAEAERNVDEIEHDIAATDTVIEDVQAEIERLQGDLLYQTVDEQVDTNNEVFRLEKSISDYENEQEKMQEDAQNVRAKIERLKQKQYDLSI